GWRNTRHARQIETPTPIQTPTPIHFPSMYITLRIRRLPRLQFTIQLSKQRSWVAVSQVDNSSAKV
ncbi:MAG TPA: hypothetical protein VE862_11905, partial [Candidatus Acidoferrum sp.]|nr:hypothetical protein [Candidatus Acidoferrum sp.]